MTRMCAGLMNGVYPSAFANRTPPDDLHATADEDVTLSRPMEYGDANAALLRTDAGSVRDYYNVLSLLN